MMNLSTQNHPKGPTTESVLSLILGIAFLLAFIGSWRTVQAEPPELDSGDRPNIVLIVADDHAYQNFGFMGDARVHTPNLDRLAARSVRFPHGYVPSSVCRPSLVSILTGLYPHEHQIYFNHPPPGFRKLTKNPELTKAMFDRLRGKTDHFIKKIPTIPRVLGKHGYRSLQTGKYWEGHYANAGFTNGMTIAEPSKGKYGDKELANGQWVAHGNGDHGLAIGRQTMEPIDKFLSAKSEKPFFIWYAPFLPHLPHDSPKKYFDIAARRPNVQEHELPYFAAIAEFDDTVGQLLASVQEHGHAENTLVAFVSDNGWLPDAALKFKNDSEDWDHTPRSKRAPFDDGLRTPILLAWDGHVVPAMHEGPVSSLDLMPTLLDAAGIASPQCSGETLWAIATGESAPDPKRAVFGELYPGDASQLGKPAGDLAYRWVRKGDYKLIVPRLNDNGKAWKDYLRAPSLYCIDRDPHETMNLIDVPECKTIAADLRGELDRWWNPQSHFLN